jgi:hypothetical protein
MEDAGLFALPVLAFGGGRTTFGCGDRSVELDTLLARGDEHLLSEWGGARVHSGGDIGMG